MKMYLKKPRSGVYAEAEYDFETGHMIVRKGARLSEDVKNYSSRINGIVEEQRKGIVEERILLEDVEFKSASGAGYFVTGRSTNGLIAWLDEEGRNINTLMGKDY